MFKSLWTELKIEKTHIWREIKPLYLGASSYERSLNIKHLKDFSLSQPPCEVRAQYPGRFRNLSDQTRSNMRGESPVKQVSVCLLVGRWLDVSSFRALNKTLQASSFRLLQKTREPYSPAPTSALLPLLSSQRKKRECQGTRMNRSLNFRL